MGRHQRPTASHDNESPSALPKAMQKGRLQITAQGGRPQSFESSRMLLPSVGMW